MSNDPHDDGDSFIVAEVTIRYIIFPDGMNMIQVDAEDNGGQVPPLITMLGMLEMAKGSVVKLVEEPEDDEDEL